MLEEVLRSINNWFEVSSTEGEFAITGGSLSGVEPLPDQFYRISGSVFNDGLHQHPANDLEDETFRGKVSLLAIPKAVIKIADDIKDWEEKNQPSAFTSESFGGYSYTRATDQNGGQLTWQGAFASKLNKWRKL